MFKVTVNKTQPKLNEKEPMTSGSQNVYVAEFEFSDEWSVLHRTAVFRAGETTINVVLDDTNRCFIPWEVLVKPGYPLYVGAFGTMGDDTVLPTIWVKIDDILEGVTTGAYPSEPTPDVYQQLLAKLEDIKGPQGETGNGIDSITKTSGDGSPGTIDTYTITMTDGSTSTFSLYNGTDGASFTVRGRYDTLDELKSEHPTGVAGEAWAVGTPEDNVIYLWDETVNEWTSLGPLRGPKGDKGDKGDVGAIGMSAYQYAVAGGYTGTEDQFKSLLADVPNKQDKISGSEGQLVGFASNGAATSVTPDRELLYSLISDSPDTTESHSYANMLFPFIDTTLSSEPVATASLYKLSNYLNNRGNSVLFGNTNYTTTMARGISLVTSVPTSITNGCMVGVY